ncbi:MAG TPA: VC0807 family protein [Streptosporangiaceae bacterium]
MSGETPARATPAAEPTSSRRTLALLVLDIGAPIGLYYGLHGAGLSTLVALGADALVPAVGVIIQLITRRHLDGVGGVVAVSVLATIALSLLTDNPRFLLAREGFITALWGLWFLATLRAPRPAAFRLARPLMEGRRSFGRASWGELWATEPAFGRSWRVSTVMWGVGLLVDAVLRVLMSYTLPVSVVPGLGGALWPVTFIVLQVVTNVYYHRAGLYRMLGAPWISRGSDDLINNESRETAAQRVDARLGR